MAERDEALIDEARLQLEGDVQNYTADLQYGGMSDAEIRDLIIGLAPAATEDLLGVPLDEIAAISLDGETWVGVRDVHREVRPGGSVVIEFQVGSISHKREEKQGIRTGDKVRVRVPTVMGVIRRDDFPGVS